MTSTDPQHSPKQSRRQKSPQERQADEFLKTILKPHKKSLMMAWGLDVLSVLFLVGLALALSFVFSDLLALQASGNLGQAKQKILTVLPIIGGCLVARLVLSSVRESILASVGVKIASSTRVLALQAVGELGLARRQFGADGALASHIIKEPDELLGYARFNVQKMTVISTPIVIGLIAASQNLQSALILFATVPLVLLCMIVIGIKTAQKSREQMDALAQMSGRFLDWLRGMNTLTRLSAVELAGQDIAKAANEYKTRTMRVLRVAFLNSTVLEFFSAISIALVAVYLGLAMMGLLPWSKGDVMIDYGSALFVLFLVPEFYLPLRRLGAEYHAKSSAIAAAKVLAPIIQTVKSHQSSSPKAFDDTTMVLDRVSVIDGGRVRLSPMSLTVKHTQKWAIMGESGSGKSTLFEVLLGVCAYQGSAKIGDIEINSNNIKDFYGQIGYLPQTPALLPISIADNLRLAKSTASEDEMVQVLTKVGLSKILQLPNGIHTILSERGGGLSGGQGQRLAIAQLLLQDAKIWLLDEPTEHLDSDTRADIHALLYQFSQGKTVLWATHDEPVSWLDGVYYLKKDSHNNHLKGDS